MWGRLSLLFRLYAAEYYSQAFWTRQWYSDMYSDAYSEMYSDMCSDMYSYVFSDMCSDMYVVAILLLWQLFSCLLWLTVMRSYANPCRRLLCLRLTR